MRKDPAAAPYRTVARFRYLLAALLLLIPVGLFARGSAGRMALIVLFSGVLLSALWALRADRWRFLTGMVLVPVALAGLWAATFFDSLPLLFAGRAVAVAVLVLVVWTLLRDIARQTRILQETIYQAACAYLIVGVIFALLYSSINAMDSAAFAPTAAPGTGPNTQDAGATVAEIGTWVYFSFVTMTTVGYGDITPVTPAARSLAILEALLGQFYVAVLVARLVGLLQTQMSRE